MRTYRIKLLDSTKTNNHIHGHKLLQRQFSLQHSTKLHSQFPAREMVKPKYKALEIRKFSGSHAVIMYYKFIV